MSRTKKVEQQELEEIKKPNKILWIILGLISSVIVFFALSKTGIFGTILNNVLTYVVGSFYIVPLLSLFGYAVYAVFFSGKYKKTIKTIIGLIVLNIDVILFSAFWYANIDTFAKLLEHIVSNFLPVFTSNAIEPSGGIIGGFFYVLSMVAFSYKGTIIVMVVSLIISALLIVPSETYASMIEEIKENRRIAKEERAKAKEEKELLKQQEEELRKQKQAEQMALEAEREYQRLEQEKQLEQEQEIVEEVPVKKQNSVLSNSKTFINLNEEEIYGKSKPVTSNSEETGEEENASAPTRTKINKVKKSTGAYHLPKPLDDFLDSSKSASSNVNATSAKLKGEKLIEILRTFDIEATLVNTYIGPSVTKFEIKPETNVKINKIMNIQDNIKMELAAKDIRIEAPIPGRSAVGVEIPNAEPIPVKMYDLMKNVPSDKKNIPLLFALGKDLMGKESFCDLAKMPHLLIAGATGSGKSVCINSIITSYLLRTNPDDVKLVLVDPKKVEFTCYKDIPHLLWPIIDDATMASNMLKKIVAMMEERYDAFAAVGVRNIDGFNEYVAENNANVKAGESLMSKLPYIVVIIDELADLMAIARKDVELSIQRITQLARASGIHLIVATQRPSTDVITGLIKSNMPSRISFAVASSIDSRTILDATGAERLLGNGDMLYCPQGENAPIRLQGVFVHDKEIRKVVDFVKKQAEPKYEDSYYEFLTNMNGTTVMQAGSVNADTMDSLYDEVVEFVTMQQKASTSLLQRRFGIGYNRAARLIDTLEDRGIIGPANGSKPREVYKKPEDEQE